MVDDALRLGISRGLIHLTAEDDQLGGRLLTLRGRRQVNFGSCSYVGLETDLRLKNAACDAVARYGVQFASSRAYVSCPPYAELERLLAAMFGAPLVVAQTTTLAHFAALPILVGREDAVICDQLVHNSVQAVMPTLQAAGTTCRFVRHSRIDRLDELVSKLAARHRRVWYLADGVYSMHGDPAPHAALRELVSRHEQLSPVHRRRPRPELVGAARARHRARRRSAPAPNGHGGLAGQGVLGGRRGDGVSRARRPRASSAPAAAR